jgi:hypothetical protein
LGLFATAWERFKRGFHNSNLDSSSNFKHLNLLVWVLFVLLLKLFCKIRDCAEMPYGTKTDTETDTDKKEQAGQDIIFARLSLWRHGQSGRLG